MESNDQWWDEVAETGDVAVAVAGETIYPPEWLGLATLRDLGGLSASAGSSAGGGVCRISRHFDFQCGWQLRLKTDLNLSRCPCPANGPPTTYKLVRCCRSGPQLPRLWLDDHSIACHIARTPCCVWMGGGEENCGCPQ